MMNNGEIDGLLLRRLVRFYRRSSGTFVAVEMSMRRWLGFSKGELMRPDCKSCSRLMRHTAGIFTVGGGLGLWVLCRLHYGMRIMVSRSLRWGGCGLVSTASATALLVRLLSAECESLNIAAFDIPK